MMQASHPTLWRVKERLTATHRQKHIEGLAAVAPESPCAAQI
jgi:hypothetical protein